MTGEAKRPVGRGFGYWASLILAAILIVVGLPFLAAFGSLYWEAPGTTPSQGLA